MTQGPPLAVLVGPTAVGKSRVAVEVAAAMGGEVVSADSMQVYRGLDIGTAKLKPEEMRARSGEVVPHHLIDVVEPTENFSVAAYQAMARQAIAAIQARGRLPLLVGGTGLYVQAVVDPYSFPELPRQPELREKLAREAAADPEGMHRRLAQVDPASAARLHPNDTRRVVRALEVYTILGRPASEFQHRRGRAGPYRLAMVGLAMEREALYRRINRRVEEMFRAGLVEEVAGLVRRGCRPEHTSMQGLGYRQVLAYLRGEMSLAETIGLVQRDTRRYAKRQFTWFRQDPRIRWVEVEESSDVTEIAQEALANFGRIFAESVE